MQVRAAGFRILTLEDEAVVRDDAFASPEGIEIRRDDVGSTLHEVDRHAERTRDATAASAQPSLVRARIGTVCLLRVPACGRPINRSRTRPARRAFRLANRLSFLHIAGN